ncbi:hypothetical protein [Bacillus marinisedimentorum]|uniref:hypothetical protein n=1 Tax=Bacillus marinisedimentorum TaxID=1821260 RepID=UPI00087330B3|nr:hypothetical protein [Bacillus marinisedimentorum]
MKPKIKISIIIFLIAFGFYYVNSVQPEQLQRDIYDENGFDVHEVGDNFTVRFKLNKNWLDISEGETQVIKEEVGGKYGSVLLLESIRNNGGNYSLLFNIKHDLDSKSGKFLTHTIFNEDGTFSSKDIKKVFTFYDREGNVLKASSVLAGGGSGPDEKFSGDFKALECRRQVEFYTFCSFPFYTSAENMLFRFFIRWLSSFSPPCMTSTR